MAFGELCFLGSILGGYRYFARDLPSTASLENFEPSLKTRVYAADSSLVGELYQQNRVLIPLEQMPDYLKDAIISVEDRKFYSHWGVDVFGVMRAAGSNLRAGHVVQGASTITQQLARNLFTMFDVSMSRKIKEMIDGGELGDLSVAWSERFGYNEPRADHWISDDDAGGGILDFCTHDVEFNAWWGGPSR